MTEPLFNFTDAITARTLPPCTLVVTLGGYADAGHSQELCNKQLLHTLPNFEVGRFDVDQLIDYRENRPTITLDRDHFADYEPPAMVLHHVLDEAGKPFLLLTGPEPALQWERLSDSIEALIDELRVDLVVTVQGVPSPVPHTRPTLITKLASDPNLVAADEPIFDKVLLGASFPAALSARLADDHHRVLGLTAHIPQYLHQSDYPSGALALLDELKRVAALQLPTADLVRAATVNRQQLDTEAAENAEVAQMIEQLAAHYDAFMATRRQLPMAEKLPTAEEIGAEAEEFLRQFWDDGPKPSSDQK